MISDAYFWKTVHIQLIFNNIKRKKSIVYRYIHTHMCKSFTDCIFYNKVSDAKLSALMILIPMSGDTGTVTDYTAASWGALRSLL